MHHIHKQWVVSKNTQNRKSFNLKRLCFADEGYSKIFLPSGTTFDTDDGSCNFHELVLMPIISYLQPDVAGSFALCSISVNQMKQE
jgi:hypothetical protein